MSIRIKDLMNLPDAISNELEERSQMKADALAHRIVNKISGNNLPPNPYRHNPYMSADSNGSVSRSTNTQEKDPATDWDKTSKRGWGRTSW